MRVRQKRREAASHVDDWLMTYADMITLLLCFFAIFMIMSSTKKQQHHAAPVVVAVTAPIPPPQAPPRPAVVATVERRPPAPDAETSKTPAKEAGGPAAPPRDETPAATAGLLPVKLDDTASRPLAVIPPPELAESAPAPAAKPAPSKSEPPQGDRITSFEMGSAAFFDPGSASLSEQGKAILEGVLPRLTAAVAEGYRIKVEGHTDDTPIDTAQYPSNWELSTARAAAVVHFFLAAGVPAERLRAIGYADTDPEAPNRDAAGNPIPANQAQNRRVVIKLEKIEATVNNGCNSAMRPSTCASGASSG
jgi:chemotaxis protein MotB